MTYFLNSPIISWLPVIFFGLLLLLGFSSYVARGSEETGSLRKNSKKMIWAAVAFYIIYPILLTMGQYYAWLMGGSFSKILLNSPLDEKVPIPQFIKELPLLQSHLGYFVFYSFGRFWINSILAVGAAFLFYLFLKFLQKRKDRFFEEGELELGFLCALVVGWPKFVIFVPLIFLLVVVISLVRLFIWKERYTALGYPFIAAALASLIFGAGLVSLLNLSVLNI